MRLIQTFAALLAFSAVSAAAQNRPTYDAVLRGTSCKQSQPAPGEAQLDCDYHVGDGLAFVIAGVGEPDAAITVTKASGYEADYYLTFGVLHGCVIVKPGAKATKAAFRDHVLPDMAFVSPKTGKVYTTWRDCQQAR